jgi:MoxR-like ATPase
MDEHISPAVEDEKLQQAARLLSALRSEIAKAVVGQQDTIDQTLIALVGAGHVLIEGVPGLGKTLLVKALAKTFDGQFSRIQFTPDLMPSDVTGHTLFDPKTGDFTTRKGPVFANLLLADEINRAPAKTQAALLEVMQEAQVTIESTAHLLPLPFMVLATQNPIEQEGTYPLPEAQLDRFLLKIRLDYPSLADEAALVRSVTGDAIGDKLNVDPVATLVEPESILALQRIAAKLIVEDKVLDYAVRLARATRDFAGLSSGAGPRGGIALVRAARGQALMAGRGFVTPDDVKQVALPVLRHRVTPAPEMEIEGRDIDELLRELFVQVEAPRA